MGASRWDYFTPYRENPADALAELRKHVFESGDYVRPTAVPDTFQFESIEDVLVAAMEDGTHSILDIHAMAGEPTGEPLSAVDAAIVVDQLMGEMVGREAADKIQEVLAAKSEEKPAKPRAEFGEAAVVSDELLIEIFGTTTPNKTVVLDEIHKVHELCTTRWTAVCVAVHEGGEPSEYLFTGVSGD